MDDKHNLGVCVNTSSLIRCISMCILSYPWNLSCLESQAEGECDIYHLKVPFTHDYIMFHVCDIDTIHLQSGGK